MPLLPVQTAGVADAVGRRLGMEVENLPGGLHEMTELLPAGLVKALPKLEKESADNQQIDQNHRGAEPVNPAGET
jgi:hypothetical protein